MKFSYALGESSYTKFMLLYLIVPWYSYYNKRSFQGHVHKNEGYCTRAQQQLRWATIATIDMAQKEGAAVPLSVEKTGGFAPPRCNTLADYFYCLLYTLTLPTNREV